MSRIFLVMVINILSLQTIAQDVRATKEDLSSIEAAILPIDASGPMPKTKDFSFQFPYDGDQCYTGACVSFACTYNLLSFLAKRENNGSYTYDYLKKDDLFSPYYTFYFQKSSSDCFNTTSNVLNTLKFLKKVGSVPISTFQVDPCQADNCQVEPKINGPLNRIKIKNFGWIYSNIYSRPEIDIKSL